MKALARWIVSKYPQAWRERYEAEVLDLITSGPVIVAETGELFRSMLVERTRAGIDVNQPQKAVARLQKTKISIVLGGWMCSVVLAGLLRWWRPMHDPEAWWLVGTLLGYVAVLFVSSSAIRSDPAVRPRGFGLVLPVWLAALCVPIQICLVGLFGWAALSDGEATNWARGSVALSYMEYGHALVLTWLIIQIWPGQELAQTLAEYDAIQKGEAAARALLASCEEWIAKGVASPLQEAQRSHDEWVKRLASVETRLKALGYRPGVAL
jgi:hypothetical protein